MRIRLAGATIYSYAARTNPSVRTAIVIVNFLFLIRSFLLRLPSQTRNAWQWDMTTGLFAGAYQGCIWTFVYRVARAELLATPRQIGWITAAPAIGYILATFWARQMDGRSKMPFVFWTWLVARGLFLLAPLLHTREQFVALVCFTPFVFSISTPAYTAIMKEIYPDAHRGRLMSVVRMGMSLMTLLAALVMGRLLDHGMGWRAGFFIGGIFGVMSAWTFSRIKLVSVPTDDTRVTAKAFLGDTLHILKRNPGYRWFTASVFVSGFGNLISATLIPLQQVDKFHVTNTQVANLQNVASIATIVGYVFWGTFLDRKGPLVTVLTAIGINLFIPLLYAGAWGMSALYLAAIASGLCSSGIDLGYLNTTLMFSETGKAAQYQALHSSFFGIRGTLAPQVAIPLLKAVGPQQSFLAAFAIMIVGTYLQLISMRDYRRQSAQSGRGGLKKELEASYTAAATPVAPVPED